MLLTSWNKVNRIQPANNNTKIRSFLNNSRIVCRIIRWFTNSNRISHSIARNCHSKLKSSQWPKHNVFIDNLLRSIDFPFLHCLLDWLHMWIRMEITISIGQRTIDDQNKRYAHDSHLEKNPRLLLIIVFSWITYCMLDRLDKSQIAHL